MPIPPGYSGDEIGDGAMTDIQNLNETEIHDAFARSGYSEVQFLSHRFLSINRSGAAVYEITFYNDEGEDDSGFLFIERKADGLLYGEF
jgi:hypothetical protein